MPESTQKVITGTFSTSLRSQASTSMCKNEDSIERDISLSWVEPIALSKFDEHERMGEFIRSIEYIDELARGVGLSIMPLQPNLHLSVSSNKVTSSARFPTNYDAQKAAFYEIDGIEICVSDDDDDSKIHYYGKETDQSKMSQEMSAGTIVFQQSQKPYSSTFTNMGPCMHHVPSTIDEGIERNVKPIDATTSSDDRLSYDETWEVAHKGTSCLDPVHTHGNGVVMFREGGVPHADSMVLEYRERSRGRAGIGCLENGDNLTCSTICNSPDVIQSFGVPQRPYEMNDVLCGQGGQNNHYGNQAYLAMRDRLQPRYKACSKSKKKAAIAKELVEYVYNRKGNFLERDPANPSRWVAITDETILLNKAKQALRDPVCSTKASSRAKIVFG